MLGVVASVLAVVSKGMQQLPTMLGPVVYRGKDVIRKTMETMYNTLAHSNVETAVQANTTLLRHASAMQLSLS